MGTRGKGLQQLFLPSGVSALPQSLNFPSYKMEGFDHYSLATTYKWPRPEGQLGCEDRPSKDRHYLNTSQFQCHSEQSAAESHFWLADQ